MGIDIIWKWKHTNAWALIPKAPLYPLHTLIEHITSVMATTWMQEENNEHHLWSHSWIFPALLSYFFILQLSLYGFAVLETARFVFKTHSQPISFHTPSSHPLSVTALSLFSWGRVFFFFFCWHQSRLSLGKGRVPWTSRQLIAGPSLMTEAAMQGASCTSGAIRGSVSCSRTLRHAAQLSLELGFGPATLQSLVDLLYLLSCSRPFFSYT